MKLILWSASAVFIFSLFVSLSFADEQLTYRAPTKLANTTSAMETPGFWISRHPSPDEVIMNAEAVAEFNKSVRAKVKQIKDFTQLPETFSGEELLENLRTGFEEIKAKGYFVESGEPASEMFFQDRASDMNMTSVPTVIEPQFGFVLRYTAQRFLPTTEGLYEQPGDFDFDYLQNSSLEIATPVVILHKSFDSQWFYTFGPVSDGWVKADDIALCALKDIEEFLSAEKWAVAVNPKVDLFSDAKLSLFEQHVQMGARFPKEKKQETAGVTAVRVPTRRSDGRFSFGTAYIEKSDVSDGFLPYTARTIYKQAFKLLNEPYGWGGMYGEQDCSRFLQEIFSTVGIDLPRDSKDQSKVGTEITVFDNLPGPQKPRAEFFPKAVPGVSVLTMKGHIMLYLGMIDNRPYAIHAVWAYRESAGDEDRVRVINRVAVSDLELGESSQKGSLMKRLTGIRIFSK